jgi:hypothetical protein
MPASIREALASQYATRMALSLEGFSSRNSMTCSNPPVTTTTVATQRAGPVITARPARRCARLARLQTTSVPPRLSGWLSL